MEILINKRHTVISVLLRVCVIILEYKFREDTNGQTLKDTDGKRRNSVASCLQRHSRCVHVNSCRMWITSETELKQQSDADLLFFLYTVSKNDPCTCELGLTDRISGASEPTSE